jgi:hypothetical protein
MKGVYANGMANAYNKGCCSNFYGLCCLEQIPPSKLPSMREYVNIVEYARLRDSFRASQPHHFLYLVGLSNTGSPDLTAFPLSIFTQGNRSESMDTSTYTSRTVSTFDNGTYASGNSTGLSTQDGGAKHAGLNEPLV